MADEFAKKLAQAKLDWRPPAQEPKIDGESMEERVQREKRNKRYWSVPGLEPYSTIPIEKLNER